MLSEIFLDALHLCISNAHAKKGIFVSDICCFIYVQASERRTSCIDPLFFNPANPTLASLTMTSVETDAQHVRMETAATLVNEKRDYFDNEPNISPSSSKRKEEPVLVSPMSPAVNDGVATSNTIPPNHPYRTLVVCFDGTGDQ